MKKILGYLSCLLLLTACVKKENTNQIIFTRSDFKQHKTLNHPETIELEDTFNDPTGFYLMQDSFVLVNNQPHSNYLLEIYSLNEKKCLLSLGTRGNGPGEFTSAFCYACNNNWPTFYLQDEGKHILYTIDFNQTLQEQKLHIDDSFSYHSDIHPYTQICYFPDNAHYVGYSMWYLDDSTYTNNVPAIKCYPKVEKDKQNQEPTLDLQKFKYFVSDVNGANPFVTTDHHLWLADLHQDKITIFDDSLHIIKTLVGPDQYTVEYDTRKSNIPMPFVIFKNGKDFSSYKDWTMTKKHIYIIYEGINNETVDPEHLKPVEVLQFDLNGNPICYYQLDQYVYHISIDSEERYLYATTRTSYKEAATFVRYALK